MFCIHPLLNLQSGCFSDIRWIFWKRSLRVHRFWASRTATIPLCSTKWLLSQSILDQPERLPGDCPRLGEWFYFEFCWAEQYSDTLMGTFRNYRGLFRAAPLLWKLSSKILEDHLLCLWGLLLEPRPASNLVPSISPWNQGTSSLLYTVAILMLVMTPTTVQLPCKNRCFENHTKNKVCTYLDAAYPNIYLWLAESMDIEWYRYRGWKQSHKAFLYFWVLFYPTVHLPFCSQAVLLRSKTSRPRKWALTFLSITLSIQISLFLQCSHIAQMHKIAWLK